MTTDATIGRVSRPRGVLTKDQARRLSVALDEKEEAEVHYRLVVLDVMSQGASFSEVSKATGLSTNTLQRWKREAGKP